MEPDQSLISASIFFECSFSDRKVELDNGVLRIVPGASRRHAWIQGSLLMALHSRLRGTGYAVLGPRMAIKTHEMSVRYPDLLVSFNRSGPEHDDDPSIDDPEVVIELHASGVSRTNLWTKLEEYRRLSSLATILLIDTDAERVRLIQRTAPNVWTDTAYLEPTDVALASLGIVLPHDEVFDRD